MQERVVRKIEPFTRFLEYAAESNAQELSFSGIAKEIGISAKTIREYYDILSETLIGKYLHHWAHSVRKQLAGHPKFYFFDTGVVNALCKRLEIHLEKQTLGFLFETWMMSEVKAHLAIEFKYKERLDRKDFSGLHSFYEDHPEVQRVLVCNVDQARNEDGVEVLPYVYFPKNMRNYIKK